MTNKELFNKEQINKLKPYIDEEVQKAISKEVEDFKKGPVFLAKVEEISNRKDYKEIYENDVINIKKEITQVNDYIDNVISLLPDNLSNLEGLFSQTLLNKFVGKDIIRWSSLYIIQKVTLAKTFSSLDELKQVIESALLDKVEEETKGSYAYCAYNELDLSGYYSAFMSDKVNAILATSAICSEDQLLELVLNKLDIKNYILGKA
jgi:hypothetical protein